LDLGNAFYQVELNESSKIKTAFSKKNEHYCFNRKPFGIAAVPATFQKLKNKVLGPLHWKEAVVYLDDILIFSQSKAEHLRRIKNVLERIKEAGLKLSRDKCHFLRTEMKFLGHIINNQAIRMDDSKIDAIKEYERSKCIKKLRSFLGLTNYYRKFINNYSDYSKNLEKLCGSNQKKLVRESVTKPKGETSKFPCINFPDLSREFILDTDNSFDRNGAVLSQMNAYENERVIAYGSNAMNPHELGYCITRKELIDIY